MSTCLFALPCTNSKKEHILSSRSASEDGSLGSIGELLVDVDQMSDTSAPINILEDPDDVPDIED